MPNQKKTGKYLKCPKCSKRFWVKKSHISKRKFCSRICKKNGIIIQCKNCLKTFYRPISLIKNKENSFCSKLCQKQGYKTSEETKKKISQNVKLVMKSPIIRKKISLSQLGRISPMKGKKHTEEAKEKNRIKHIGLLSGKKHPNWRGGKPKCQDCGKQLGAYSSRFCTKHVRIGERAYNWKGKIHEAGRVNFKNAIRKCFKYRQWHSDILVKDNYICQICFKNSSRKSPIEVDHYPQGFSQIIDEYNIKTLEEAYQCEQLWNINNGRTLCRECHKIETKNGRKKIWMGNKFY